MNSWWPFVIPEVIHLVLGVRNFACRLMKPICDWILRKISDRKLRLYFFNRYLWHHKFLMFWTSVIFQFDSLTKLQMNTLHIHVTVLKVIHCRYQTGFHEVCNWYWPKGFRVKFTSFTFTNHKYYEIVRLLIQIMKKCSKISLSTQHWDKTFF